MAYNFEGIEDEEFYEADTHYGPLGEVRNVSQKDMPDAVSQQAGLRESVATSWAPDDGGTTRNMHDAMTEIVAKTCTAQFHKRKGYVDSDEASSITFNELLRLFDIQLHKSITRISDVIIELEDCFIYCHSGDAHEKLTINPDDLKAPSDDRKIIYILTQDVIDHLNREREYREHCEKVIERLATKRTGKPILVFRWADSILRGGRSFSAPAILMKLNETGFEKILCFQGVYRYSHTKKSGEVVLRRRGGRKGEVYKIEAAHHTIFE